MHRFSKPIVLTCLVTVVAAGVLLAPVVLAATQSLVMNPGDTLTVTCSTSLSTSSGSQADTLVCATPVPTSTPTAVPPTATPTSGTTSGTGPAGVPLCAHDPTAFHGLVELNADGSIRCTYTHTHMDDPHALDSVLGPLPSYLGGDISYPWQTVNATTGVPENTAKHRVYDWSVISNAACITSGAQYSFNNFRLEAHLDGNMGATTRFHSYWLQAQTCDPNNPSYKGTVSIGGHQDTGVLMVNNGTPQGQYVPLPGDPSTGAQSIFQRIHGQPAYPRYDATWYSGNQNPQGNTGLPRLTIQMGTRKADWGPVDPNNPSNVLFYGPPYYGGSFNEPGHLLVMYIGADFPGAQNGIVNYDGYTDRWGEVVPNCSPVGIDCIPVSVHNVKVGSYQFRNDAHNIGTRNYNVFVNGQSLIQFPN